VLHTRMLSIFFPLEGSYRE